MAFSHLSMETESYQLFLSNSDNENNLSNPNISSAGSFELVLDRTIDLSPLLYMKSTNAEIAISHLSLTNLPLTVTKDEEIKVQVNIPSALAGAGDFECQTRKLEEGQRTRSTYLSCHLQAENAYGSKVTTTSTPQ